MSTRQIELETPRLVRRISVIEVHATRGKGIEGSPIRIVRQYWDDDGTLLAEHDPEPSATPEPQEPTP